MIEKTLWHPVGKAADLAGSPKAVRLLEEDVVVWQTPDGRFQAWVDRCPHRGAKLSLGRVQDGRLECAYHGWQFDGRDGLCSSIPYSNGKGPFPLSSSSSCDYFIGLN